MRYQILYYKCLKWTEIFSKNITYGLLVNELADKGDKSISLLN